MFSIEDRGQTDRVTALPSSYALNIDFWPWTMTFTFNPRRAMVVAHTHTQSSKIISWFKDNVETNGRTDGRTDATGCFSFPANAVGNKRWLTRQTFVTGLQVGNKFARTRLHGVKRGVRYRQVAGVTTRTLAVQVTKNVRRTAHAAVIFLHTPGQFNTRTS